MGWLQSFESTTLCFGPETNFATIDETQKNKGDGMTPEQKLKWAIVSMARELLHQDPLPFHVDDIDSIFYDETNDFGCEMFDAECEIREGQIETNIEPDTSRHYESKSVAMQFPDGSWVGWTYWYGGGKHGQPESIPWMDAAYDLKCTEREEMVVVRDWCKVEKADQ